MSTEGKGEFLISQFVLALALLLHAVLFISVSWTFATAIQTDVRTLVLFQNTQKHMHDI